jgi:hypothetical protein
MATGPALKGWLSTLLEAVNEGVSSVPRALIDFSLLFGGDHRLDGGSGGSSVLKCLWSVS